MNSSFATKSTALMLVLYLVSFLAITPLSLPRFDQLILGVFFLSVIISIMMSQKIEIIEIAIFSFILLLSSYAFAEIGSSLATDYLPTIVVVFLSYAIGHRAYASGFGERSAKISFYLIFLVGMLSFLEIALRKFEALGDNFYYQSNNSGHIFIVAVMISWYIYNRFNKPLILFSIICFVLTLMSFKRSAIILLFFLTAFFFVDYLFNKGSKLRWRLVLLFATIPAGLLFLWIYRGILLYRFTLEGGSGRAEIYGGLINLWLEAGVIEKLLGHGFFHSTQITPSLTGGRTAFWAHSDFLEILISFGVLGLFFYIAIFILLFLRLSLVINFASNQICLFVFLFIYWIIKATVSGFFVEKLSIVPMFLLGAIIAEASFYRKRSQLQRVRIDRSLGAKEAAVRYRHAKN